MKNKFLFFSILISLFVINSQAQAASFAIVSPKQVYAGQPVELEVNLVDVNEPINALSGKIIFNTNDFSFQSAREGGSIVSLWLEQPKLNIANSVAEINFSGVLPGGSGMGKVLGIILLPKQNGKASLAAGAGHAFLNDGKGTAINIAGYNLALNILPAVEAPAAALPNVKDITPPEIFEPELARNEKIFNNQWFVVFNAQDKDSGIDHYEIAESTNAAASGLKNLWQESASPYILKDQSLKSFVYVKAVDKAGNERVEQVKIIKPSINYANWKIYGIILAILLALSASIFVVERKLKTKI